MKEKVANFANWFNNEVVGNPFTYVIAIILVILVYAAMPIVGGYTAWNAGLGLFFNTASSSFELITGIGAVVGVVALHKRQTKHGRSLDDLHTKIDKLTEEED